MSQLAFWCSLEEARPKFTFSPTIMSQPIIARTMYFSHVDRYWCQGFPYPCSHPRCGVTLVRQFTASRKKGCLQKDRSENVFCIECDVATHLRPERMQFVARLAPVTVFTTKRVPVTSIESQSLVPAENRIPVMPA